MRPKGGEGMEDKQKEPAKQTQRISSVLRSQNGKVTLDLNGGVTHFQK